MLVLTRRVGESILIYPSTTMRPDMTVQELFGDGPVRITVTRISGGQSRIGIIAPEALSIAREEIAEGHDA
jgi:sRNA-binding carbon storage regulator CsrA